MKRLSIITMLVLTSWSITAPAMSPQPRDDQSSSELDIDKLKRCHTQKNIAVQILMGRLNGMSKQEQIESLNNMPDELVKQLENRMLTKDKYAVNKALDVKLQSIIDEAYELPDMTINPDEEINDEQFQYLKDFGKKTLERCLI